MTRTKIILSFRCSVLNLPFGYLLFCLTTSESNGGGITIVAVIPLSRISYFLDALAQSTSKLIDMFWL